jgi:hypothetical protein
MLAPVNFFFSERSPEFNRLRAHAGHILLDNQRGALGDLLELALEGFVLLSS